MNKVCLLLLELVLLEGSHEGLLVGRCLEATMTKLGAGVDELKVNLLHETLLGQSSQGLKGVKNYFHVVDVKSIAKHLKWQFYRKKNIYI